MSSWSSALERLEERLVLSAGSISGIVYDDVDGDGQRDPTETGLAGVTVYVDLDGDGTLGTNEPVAITNQNGLYVFEDLSPGRYVIREVAPEGYSQTTPHATTEFFYGLEYDARTLVQIDATTGSVTQIGSHGISDLLTAMVVDRRGELFALSSSNGNFYQLDPATGAATYIGNAGRTVRASLAYDPVADEIYGLGASNTGPTGLVRFDRTTGIATPIVGNANLSGTFSDATWDPIGQRVIAFENTNDQFYALDPTTGNATLLSTTSFPIRSYGLAYDAARGFLLDSDKQGQFYRVDLNTGQLDLALTLSIPVGMNDIESGGPLFAHVVTLQAGEALRSFDFGNQATLPGRITGTVFSDRDRDGRQDADEVGLAGVTVYLDLNQNGILDPAEPMTLSAIDGTYRFDAVPPGEYVVRQIAPTGFEASAIGSGNGVYYSTDAQTKHLKRIDQATGIVTSIPLTTSDGSAVPTLHALVYTNDGELYALEANLYPYDALWKIDPETGLATRIGSTWHNHAWDMTYDPLTDTIYGAAYINSRVRLGTIDRTTGTFNALWGGAGVAATGSTGALTGMAGLAFDTDQRRLIAYDFHDGEIYSFSLDGNTTLLSQTTAQLTGGLTYDGDRFVTLERSNNTLIAINPDAGTWKVIGYTSENFFEESIEFVPGPNWHAVTVLPDVTIAGRDFGNIPSKSDLGGTVWKDLNGDGRRDENEPGIGGVTLYVDQNGNGVYDDALPVTNKINAGDYASETVLDSVPGVSLTALSGGQIFDTVKSFNGWFAHRLSYGREASFWGRTYPALRADFEKLASEFSVNLRPFGSSATVWLRAYDAAGNVLIDETVVVSGLTRLTRAASGIRYVLISATTNSQAPIEINELTFTTTAAEPTVVTNDDGTYVFRDLPAGHYSIRPLTPTGWQQTSAGNEQNLYYGTAYVPGSGGDLKIVTIDAVTGEVTWIGEPLQTRLHGLVRTNLGLLFGVSYTDDSLYVVDPQTGKTRLIGHTGWDLVGGLAYDPFTDTLYTLGMSAEPGALNRLLIIDPQTGQATAIGSGIAGLTGTSGLAFDVVGRRVIAFDNADGEFYAFNLDGTAVQLSLGPNVRTWAFSDGPDGFVLQPHGTGDGFLSVVDPDTAQLSAPLLMLSVAARLESLDWNFDRHRYVVALDGASIGGVDFGLSNPNAPRVTDVRFGYGPDRWIDSDDLVDRNAPWRITKIAVTFDRHVEINMEDLSVVGVLGGVYSFSMFSYDFSTRTAVWTLAVPVERDRLTIALDADGAATDGNVGVHSNGEYLFDDDDRKLDVLFGDVNNDGVVNVVDALVQRLRAGTSDPWTDLNGDGTVNVVDALLLRLRANTSLPQ